MLGILIPGFFYNISEAANTNSGICLTCNGTPAAISQINTMTREILSAIKTVGVEPSSYAGKPVSPIRFEDGYFNPPKTSFFSKTMRWAREGLGSILAVGRIFINLNKYGVAESLDSKTILVKGKIYKRDWNKMEDVGQEIANKKFALSVGGGRNDAVRSKTYQKMQDIIAKYQTGGLLSADSVFSPGITYSDILGMLENLNIMTKHQIIVPKSNKLTQNLGDNGILIKISNKAVESIALAYECVADQKCENSRTQFNTDIKKIIDMSKSGVGKVGQDIGKTSERLADAIVGVVKDVFPSQKEAEIRKNAEELGLSADEYKALQSRYGLTAAQMKTAGLSGYKNDRRRSQRQTIKKGFTDMLGEKKQTKDLILPSNNNKTGNPKETSFKLTMLTSTNDILDEASEQNDYVMMAQNADVMTRFGFLSTQLTELENLVGNEKNGLIKTLGNACKNQCSNISSKKCFY